MYKHDRSPPIIIKQAVYFKLRFTLKYRDVEELLAIRGVNVNHFYHSKVDQFSIEMK